MMNSKVKGIYLHIPFCQDICFYCDFCKVLYQKDLANRYLERLENEFNSYEIICEDIESIYIGGGTPSVLNEKQLVKLMALIKPESFVNLKEFTFEANPEQMTKEKITILQKNLVNRISLGVQTFNPKILKSLNRQHTKEDVFRVINDLREVELKNISIDLMYGFNNQTLEDIKIDLECLIELNITHVALYSLLVEPGSVFYNNNYQVNEDEYLFDEFIKDYLTRVQHFEHYEVSNFALNNNYSQHNLMYWHNEKYYGIGLGASGYLENYRYYNTKSLTKYLNGDTNLKKEYYLNDLDILKDEILVKFRLFNGIDLCAINKKYSIDFTKYFESVIIININKIYIVDNKLFFTKEGKLWLNDIIIDFIDKIKEG